MSNANLGESQAGIKISRSNINNLIYVHGTAFMAESKEELKSFLRKVKEESEKPDLKLNIQKTKIMASFPSFHGVHMGKQCKQWLTLFSWASKSLQMVTAVMKLRLLLLLGKAMTNLDNILKSRDITLPTNFHIDKAMVFPVIMNRRESWTIQKTEHQRIDAFKL